jgi:hypothetical protein
MAHARVAHAALARLAPHLDLKERGHAVVAHEHVEGHAVKGAHVAVVGNLAGRVAVAARGPVAKAHAAAVDSRHGASHAAEQAAGDVGADDRAGRQRCSVVLPLQTPGMYCVRVAAPHASLTHVSTKTIASTTARKSESGLTGETKAWHIGVDLQLGGGGEGPGGGRTGTLQAGSAPAMMWLKESTELPTPKFQRYSARSARERS